MHSPEIYVYFLTFAFILAAAYYVTRFVSSRANRMLQGKHLKIVETINLGTDKKVILLKAGEKYLLISTGGKNIQYLTEVELKEEAEGDDFKTGIPKPDFARILSYIDRVRKKAKNKEADKLTTESDNSSDRFKDNLDKLKKITKDYNGTGGPE